MILWIAALLITGVAFGQTKAQISGFVQDRSGALVREASVSVVNMDTGIRRAVRSNGEGFYAVSSLTAGTYKITVRKEGFQTLARVGVALQATEVGQIDFVLDLGSVQEVITVNDTPSIIRTEDAASGIQLGSATAGALPLNGRGLQGLIELAPGILPTPANAGEAGQFSTNGQRANANYFTVDGVSANNGISGSGLPGQFSGGALPSMSAIGSLHSLATFGELEEVRVQTSTFSPEFGRLPGAQVSVITRSGSNDFHGEASGSFRNSALTANDWFSNRAGLDEPEQRLTDFGATLGGPIKRNRSFFLGSFERISLRQPVAFETVVPTIRTGWLSAYPEANGPDLGNGTARLTAQTSSPADVTTRSLRIDHAMGSRGLVFGRYSLAPSRNESGFLQRNEARFRSQTLTFGAITTAASDRLTNDARVSVSNTRVRSDWKPGQAGPVAFDRLLAPLEGQQRLWGVSIEGIPGLVMGDRSESRQRQWTLIDTVALQVGRHDLRFGVDYQRLAPERDLTIISVVGQYRSVLEAASGASPDLTYSRAGAGSSIIETFSAFAQDTWHVSPRLNLTYGLRWEFTPPPSYRNAPPVNTYFSTDVQLPQDAVGAPVWRARYRQFAPRIGAAYRLDNAGRLILRAGAGVFYDLGFSSAVDLLNGTPFNRWRAVFSPAAAPIAEVGYGFARDLRLPYSVEWNVTLERALSQNSAVSAGYVGSAGRNLLRREGFPEAILATNHGRSSYHSLQLQGRSRSRRGLQGVVSYTWSHAIDNGSWDSGTFLVFPSGTDRGRANFDVRHNFQAALSYHLPKAWLLSGIFRARTGFPIDVVARENAFGLGFDNLRPDLVKNPWTQDGRLDPTAFRVPLVGQGTLGRNSIEGFGLAQLDLSLEREWSLTERGRLRLRVEAYNLTNQTSFADPNRFLSNPLFGQSTSLVGLMLGAGRPNSGLSPAFQPGGPRSLQIGATYRF